MNKEKENLQKRRYTKPETRKHDSMNVVQGSGLYKLYTVVLYYWH